MYINKKKAAFEIFFPLISSRTDSLVPSEFPGLNGGIASQERFSSFPVVCSTSMLCTDVESLD